MTWHLMNKVTKLKLKKKKVLCDYFSVTLMSIEQNYKYDIENIHFLRPPRSFICK